LHDISLDHCKALRVIMENATLASVLLYHMIIFRSKT